MTYSHLNRRLHLYLGLALLPWFFMYGISSVPFAHNQFFERRDAAKGLPLWTLRAERTLDVPVPESAAGLRAFGATLLHEVGIAAPPSAHTGRARRGLTCTVLVLEIDSAEVLRRSEEAHGGGSALSLGPLPDGYACQGRLRAGRHPSAFVERRRRPRVGGDDRVGRVRPLHVVGASRAASLGLAGDCRRSCVLSSLHHALVIGSSSFPTDGPRLALGLHAPVDRARAG